MFKVLIADDEIKVCQLIKNLVSWDELGLEVVACVNDGISALEIIKESSPNLVITDIRMPGYDGIELIKRAKEINNNIEFIIISGYKHFDYAHNAIKFGVEDYLLKPLKKVEFISALKKTISKFENKDRQIDKNELLEIQIENDKKNLRLAFMVDILFRTYDSNPFFDFNTINNNYHFNFKDGYFQAIIIKADIGYEENNTNINKLLDDKITKIVHKHLDGVCHEIILYSSNSGVFCVLNYQNDMKNNIKKQYKIIIDELMALNELFFGLKITIGTGLVVTEISDLYKSLDNAKTAINERIVLGTGKVIEAHKILDIRANKNIITIKDIITAEEINIFSRYIEYLDVGAIKSWIKDIYIKISNNKNITGDLVIDISNEIIDSFIFNLKKQKIELKNKSKLLKIHNEKIQKCSSIDEIYSLVLAEILGELEQIIEEKQNSEIKPIRDVKRYMENNYSIPISLEDVSGIAGFNSTYFSYFFKKETGMNFLEYLADIRINKAKQSLIDTKKTIAEIAESVGYIDLKHFSKLFKKSTGLTPSEYRKIYQ